MVFWCSPLRSRVVSFGARASARRHGIAKYWAHGYPCNWLQSLEDGEPGFGSRAWDKSATAYLRIEASGTAEIFGGKGNSKGES